MKKSNTVEAQVERALLKSRAALAEKAVATATQMGNLKIRPQVVEALLEEGFEASGKKLRVPLETQLSDLVLEGAFIPLTQLHKRLAGTTVAEAKKLAKIFHESERAKIVVRGKERCLVAPSETTLSSSVLAQLSRELTAAAKWLKSANTKTRPGTVLRSDLLESFAEWESLVPEAKQSASKLPPRSSEEDAGWKQLVGFLRALGDEESGLVSVPHLAKRAAQDAPTLDLKRELLGAFRKGQLELRPEGGIGRLSREDAALCPVGAGGLPLSWARLLGDEG